MLVPKQRLSLRATTNRALFTERKFLLNHQNLNWSNPAEAFPVEILEPIRPGKAEAMFLDRFYRLSKGRYS